MMDRRRLLSASCDRTVRLWDVASGKELKRLTGHTDYVYCVAFTPDGRRALSGGADKREAWERLLSEHKLGALALLRNLRNMKDAGVREELMTEALRGMKTDRVLPFRFVAAARHAPKHEAELEEAMFRSLKNRPLLPGTTALVVDTSPSMCMEQLSQKSDMDRFEAAAGLAILLR